jgi:hypothetical protein
MTNVEVVGKNTDENIFNQLVSHIEESIDLSALAKELSELRQVIKDKQVSVFANAGGGTIAQGN